MHTWPYAMCAHVFLLQQTVLQFQCHLAVLAAKTFGQFDHLLVIACKYDEHSIATCSGTTSAEHDQLTLYTDMIMITRRPSLKTTVAR